MRETKFLATTAIEEFWDPTLPLVFTGPWCKRYDRQVFWKSLSHETLPPNWINSSERAKAYQRVKEMKFEIVGNLAKSLNRVHGTSHSDRFWLILVGPWLHWYLSTMLDHYTGIKKALNLYPALTTIALSPRSFVVPGNTSDYAFLAYSDSYHLQLYSRVLDFFKYKCLEKEYEVELELEAGHHTRKWWQRALDQFLKWGGGEAGIVSHTPYFPRYFQRQLCLRMGGQMWPSIHPVCNPGRVRANIDVRGEISLNGGEDEFSELTARTVPMDIPTCFVEEFSATLEQARSHYPQRPKRILSANSWYYDEEFKFWAAAAADEGSTLIGTQHGTSYGVSRLMPSEEHERDIVDRYYSWGWTGDGYRATVVPLPANKLVGTKRLRADDTKRGILWASTSESRYLREIAYGPEAFEEYLEWQGRFLRALMPEMRRELRFRPHHQDFGWDVAQRLLSIDPSLAIEEWDVAFAESMARSRIYVCDHCSTTFGEALAASQPTILFWNPEHNELRPEAEEWFSLLRSAGILFYSAECAAEALEVAYGDVLKWWEDPVRQTARMRFCNHFARTSLQPVREWAAELRDLCAT